MATARSMTDLIIRVRKAQRNLGPRNPYRILLDECVEAMYAVVRQYADLQEHYAAVAGVDAAVARDRGVGNAVRADVGGDAGDAEPGGAVVSDTLHPADAGSDDPAGYGHAV